jgi:hypothetical protein
MILPPFASGVEVVFATGVPGWNRVVDENNRTARVVGSASDATSDL